MQIAYNFNLPPEEAVILRNRTITTYYAQLYQRQPRLYKWAGMAAFASFHIGEKLQLWDWEESGIKALSATCTKKSRSLEDDFQLIRIINNEIFTAIGGDHLRFAQLDFANFKAMLTDSNRNPIVIKAFEKLHEARTEVQQKGCPDNIDELIWEANTEILWHEQSEVVQPLFDKLSGFFSSAMTFFASFDYDVNHHQTRSKTRSRFLFFMLFKGFHLVRKNWFIPRVTKLEHRWYWIHNDLLKKWQIVEAEKDLMALEIKILSQLEKRNLIL